MRSARRTSLCCLPLLLVNLVAAKAFTVEKSLTDAVQPYVDSHSLAGAVMVVANKDQIIEEETVGFMDIAEKKPMRADCTFWIASMSKPITCTAVMMLVDEGKINVDDPVEKYLPEFKDIMVIAEQDGEHVLLKKPQQPLLVRHVMSHTSGMRFASPLERPTLDMLRLRDAVSAYALQPLQWEPGSKYQYSNAGINTAARIIEVVTGQSFEDFMQQRLFDPLGMKDTTFWPNEEQAARLAKPYKPNADKTDLEETTISQLTYPLSDRARQPMPAGGLFSTGRDVARFCQMLLRGGEIDGKRYLSEASLKQMTSKQTAESLPDQYGFGYSTGGNTFGHGGALATNMTVDPASGLVTVWLVQHAGFPNNGGESQGAFRKAAQAFGGK